MVKKILLSSLMLLSLHTFAQEGTASPYSYYGIGEVKFKGTVENSAMGGIGILNDSIHLNLQNPATLAALRLTTFTVGGTFSSIQLKNDAKKEETQRTSLGYLAMAFPVSSKATVGLGIMPYTALGYKIVVSDDLGSKKYDGNGGLNKFFISTGYQISPKFRVGAELGYNFGTIQKSSVYIDPIVQYYNRQLSVATLRGFMLNTGIQFKTKIGKNDLISSITFAPTTILKSDNSKSIAKILFDAQGNEVVFDSKDIPFEQTKMQLPSKISFGSGYGLDRKWFVGFESSFQGIPDYKTTYITNASFEAATKIAVGGYYIPKYNSFNSYFDRVTYRAGFRHENTGLIINAQPIRETALTLGLGLPLVGTFSNINLGLELGKKGTTKNGLIQENYLNLSVGISFNDRWFVKRKFD